MTQPESVSSPVATGGAGTTFEQHVGAMFLALLLTRGIPAVFKNCQVDSVSFQTAGLGWQTDDILITCSSPVYSQRNLAIQVKRTFRVQASSIDCQETFRGFWSDFNDPDKFDRDSDALLLVTLRGTNTLLEGLGSLLDCARNSSDESDFAHRLSTPGLSSQEARKCEAVIKGIISAPDSLPPANKDFWQFLKAVHLLSLDLTTSTAQTEGSTKQILALACTESNPLKVAETAWLKLIEVAASAAIGARTIKQQDLPDQLLSQHRTIDVAQAALQLQRDHTQLILGEIRSTIAGSVVLPRDELKRQAGDLLENHQSLILTGAAGSGKSAIAKSLVLSTQRDYECLSFRAEEFAKSSIDDVLRGPTTGVQLKAMLGAQQRALIHVEGVERLSEHTVRDALADLVGIAEECENVHLLLTCRDYAATTAITAFFRRGNLAPAVMSIPPLSNQEMDEVAASLPVLEAPFSNFRIKELLRNPFLLDVAAKLDWTGRSDLPTDAVAFRRRCWSEVIRCDSVATAAMPDRRERALVSLSEKRARELRPFVPIDGIDEEALDRLFKDGIVSKDDNGFAAPVHDVIEDWAIIRWTESVVARQQWQATPIAESVGEHPAIRRGFREWLNEVLEHDTDKADRLVIMGYGDGSVAQHFRDDLLVSMLRSHSVRSFISRQKDQLLANEGRLLVRLIHLLRTACKKNPSWLGGRQVLPSVLLEPDGDAWPAVLEAAADGFDSLTPANSDLLVGLLEDWARGVSVWTPLPDGAVPVGKIAFGLLDLLDGWGHEDQRERILQVIAKVPRCDESRFADLLQRATDGENQRDTTCDELAEILLSGIEGTAACRDFPELMAKLALSKCCLTDTDLDLRFQWSSPDSDDTFGINGNIELWYFRVSAIRGPFRPLLRFHPADGVKLLLDLLNHAGNWYGERKSISEYIEAPFRTSISVPGYGKVQQWANERLWLAYRGTSVVPHVVQCALMALEEWLIEICDNSADVEPWLLEILCKSNNVMTTAVVASVCNAYPKEGGAASLALLTSREAFSMDLRRTVSEMDADFPNLFPYRDPMAKHYNSERQRSNALEHRRLHLENLAINLQLADTRDEVWKIIDGHYALLPDGAERSEEDRTFLLALHRMDIRKWELEEVLPVSDNPLSENEDVRKILVKPKINVQDQDLQQFVDSGAQMIEQLGASTWLTNWGLTKWENGSTSEDGTWRTALEEAKKRQVSEQPASFFQFDGSAVGYVAAVCIRDHWHEMAEEEQKWCLGTAIAEVERECDSNDYMVHVSNNTMAADRPAAYVIPKILGLDPDNDIVLTAVAKAITHTSPQVSLWCAEGARNYLASEHPDLLLRCAGAFAMQAHLLGAQERLERIEYVKQRTYARQERSVGSRIFGWIKRILGRLKRIPTENSADYLPTIPEAVRAAFLNQAIDAESAVGQLGLMPWSARPMVPHLSSILGGIPESALARDFHLNVAQTVVDSWIEEKGEPGQRRHFESEYQMVDRFATFVLTLPADIALRCCKPFLDGVEVHPKEMETFITSLIAREDQVIDEGSSFWDIWQAFADRVLDAPWLPSISHERSKGMSLVDKVLFGMPWEEGIHHWTRLQGHEEAVDALVGRLPAVPPILSSYTRYLHSIGGESLPHSFGVVANILQNGADNDLLSNGSSMFCLESLLGRYVYGEPFTLKSDPKLRAAALSILDQLVEAGSSASYSMRDDFVTPASIF